MDSDPVSHLLLVDIRGATHWYSLSTFFFFFLIFILQVVGPLLSLLTSSYKPGDLLHMWSVEPSTGWACSFWECCSAMLWWETCCYLLFKVVSHSQDILLIPWLDSSLIPPFCPGRPRSILLPDFRGLHHLQWRISAVVCSRDQRKDNGGDNARLQPSELQEHWHWKFWHYSFNWILRHYRSFNFVGFTALNSLDNLLSNVPDSQSTLFNVICF